MGFRVLLVDDSPIIRMMLEDMLGALGHQVVAHAETAAAAKTAYKQHRPDLIMLDVSLPDGDGLSLFREIRRMDPLARALLVTGNNQKKLEEQALRMGVKGVLYKPFSQQELSAAIQKIPGASSLPGGST